ncbi:hypothetical protein LXL04_016708 [Taraxacum kok-saghyz]
MSLLNTLWDDILAGPPPDKGLGKLRKQSSNLSFRSLSSDKAESETAGNSVVDSMRVTRSIMIAKPERTLSDTPPASPAGSTPPVSPFAGKLFVLSHHLLHLAESGWWCRKILEASIGQNINRGSMVIEEAEDRSRLGFGGSQHRTLLRRQAELEIGALVLLTSCEI